MKQAAVVSPETSHLVEQADPIDRPPVLAAPRIDLSHFHYHMLWEQVDCSAGSMAMLPVAVVPMGLVMQAYPRVAAPLHFLNLDFPTRQVVVEQEIARPTLELAVVLDFAYPTRQVVAERGFVRPTQRPVAVEPGSDPTLELAVGEPEIARPIPEVVAEHPTCWVVALVDPRDLEQA